MTISTETQEIVDYYKNKKNSDIKQKDEIGKIKEGFVIPGEPPQKIYGVEEMINNFTNPIKLIDNDIVILNQEIAYYQDAILSVGQDANSALCLGFEIITVPQDQLYYRGWTYDEENPFEEESGLLTLENVGVGTENYTTQLVGAARTYSGPILNSGGCAGYAQSISNLSNKVIELQTERNLLMGNVNILKSKRSTFELQKWSYDQMEQDLDEEIQESDSMINFLENPSENIVDYL